MIYLVVFSRTEIIPHSIAYFPESVRRSVLTSDTDSTIFTSQELIFWYLGSERYDSVVGRALQGFLILLSTETTTHILCQMSTNFGIVEERLRDIYMKNEFTFDTYVNTQVAKHYFATISEQEGNVFDEVKREYKGVQLISSNLPIVIRTEAKNMMNEIMDKTKNNENLSLTDYIKRVYSIEQDILSSLKKGDLSYFKIYKVKSKDSYTEGLFNNYEYYKLWDSVFANKYLKIEEPPYQTIKITTTLTSKSKLAAWVETLEPALKEPMLLWIASNNRKEIPVMMLPSEVIRSCGLPTELAPIVDYRSMISEICHVLYMILETLGFYLKSDYILSDYIEGTIMAIDTNTLVEFFWNGLTQTSLIDARANYVQMEVGVVYAGRIVNNGWRFTTDPGEFITPQIVESVVAGIVAKLNAASSNISNALVLKVHAPGVGDRSDILRRYEYMNTNNIVPFESIMVTLRTQAAAGRYITTAVEGFNGTTGANAASSLEGTDVTNVAETTGGTPAVSADFA